MKSLNLIVLLETLALINKQIIHLLSTALLSPAELVEDGHYNLIPGMVFSWEGRATFLPSL